MKDTISIEDFIAKKEKEDGVTYKVSDKGIKALSENLPTPIRKYHYWRGFKACLILVVAPIVICIVVAMQMFVNANT